MLLRTSYLALAQGNYCAAKLLAVLENWTNWFVRRGKFDRWVKLTSESLIKHLLGEHNAKQIRAALKLLVSLKFIRQEKRRSHKHDQAYFYWLDVGRTQEAVNALEPLQEPETEQDYLKIEATLESENLAHIDAAKSTTTRAKPLMPVDAAKPTTSPIKRLKPLRRLMRQNRPHRCGSFDSFDVAKSAACLNRDLHKDLNSSNINIADLKAFEEKENINQERSSLNTSAPLIEEPKSRAQPIAPHVDQGSAAPLVALKAVLPPIALPPKELSQVVQPTALEPERPTVVLMQYGSVKAQSSIDDPKRRRFNSLTSTEVLQFFRAKL